MGFPSRMRASAAIAVVFPLFLSQVTAIVLNYCSSQNLGIGGGTYTKFQSNGWCSTHCSQYAVAITQGHYCWCSNDVPADTVDISQCNGICPGYGWEDCGNVDGTLWGYVLLGRAPSSTVAPSTSKPTHSSSSSSSSSTSSSSPSSKTSSKSTRTSSSTSTSTIHHTRPSEPPHTKSSSSLSSATTKMTATTLETVSGSVLTRTVVHTMLVPPPPPAERTQSPVASSGVSGGQIAGAVIGGLVGFAAIVGLALWFLLRFRRRQQSYAASDAERPESGVTRNTSVLSSTGLLGPVEKAHLPPIHTGRGNGAFDMESASPSSDRRHSRPIFYDQRLNVSALIDNDSSSRASIGTMQDNRDYTRTLNVRNPDPNPDDDGSDAEPDHNQQAQVR